MTRPRRTVALFALPALLVAQGAHAQDMSTEVGSATVWFALLVVVFALLVSVGLFMAHDEDEAQDTEPQPKPAPSRTPALRAARRRHPQTHRKQQEFT